MLDHYSRFANTACCLYWNSVDQERSLCFSWEPLWVRTTLRQSRGSNKLALPTRGICVSSWTFTKVDELEPNLSARVKSKLQTELRIGSKSTTKNSWSSIPTYAQDPAFNALDKLFLEESLGITVLNDQEAWDKIGKDSMVFAPGTEQDRIFKIANRRPAIWWPVDSCCLVESKE